MFSIENFQYSLSVKGLTQSGERIHALIKDTPLDMIIRKVSQFLDANARIIFWGGACLAFALSPQMFFLGAGLGMLVAELTPLPAGKYGWKGQHTAPLDRAAQTVAWFVTRMLPPQAQAFVNGSSPGHTLHRIVQGQYYPGVKGIKAFWFEVEWTVYELSRWFPWVDAPTPKLPSNSFAWLKG